MSRKIRNLIVARCAECESRINFNKEPEIGMIVTCRECGEKMEVIDINPVELDWAYEDENYNDDDDFYSLDDNDY